MRTTFLKTFVLAIGVVATASVADAQAQGLSVNARVGYASGYTVKGDDFGSEEIRTDGGILGGVGIAYGFTPMFGLYANLDAARQGSSTDGLDGDFGVAYFEFGTRVNLTMLQSAKFLPYVNAAYMSRAMAADVDLGAGDTERFELSGAGISIGGGAQYRMSPRFSFDGGVQVGMGRFDEGRFGSDRESMDLDRTTTTRVTLGLNWFPMAK